MKQLPPGCVMVDVQGLALTPAEHRRLEHPYCAGVILFARNYRDPDQLRRLCDQIRAVREPQLLIAVDHEGGRVQRFREGFTRIPPMRTLGKLWDHDRVRALDAARDIGIVIGKELGECGVDFSFAPVLDIDRDRNTVIGDRAFHSTPTGVTELANAFIDGLHACGVSAVGKHFPGHGGVATDTHLDIAIDRRRYEEIEREDLQPFMVLCRGALGGVMPAHVIYPEVDAHPAGFSRFWLNDVLRARLGFDGVIFSDDLSMHGASVAGNAPARARAALAAGCDVVLVCNAPDDAEEVLRSLGREYVRADPQRLLALHCQFASGPGRTPVGDEAYEQACAQIAGLMTVGRS